MPLNCKQNLQFYWISTFLRELLIGVATSIPPSSLPVVSMMFMWEPMNIERSYSCRKLKDGFDRCINYA